MPSLPQSFLHSSTSPKTTTEIDAYHVVVGRGQPVPTGDSADLIVIPVTELDFQPEDILQDRSSSVQARTSLSLLDDLVECSSRREVQLRDGMTMKIGRVARGDRLPSPTNNVICIDFCCSFWEMYSSAGRIEGVRASESKVKSGDSGGEIMFPVIVRGST